jgi:cytochrome c-type biogenesis protein CcmH/NrfF
MLLKWLKPQLGRLLGNWDNIGLLAFALFAIGLMYGWKAYVAHRQGVGLHGIVAWYGKGYGNLIQYEFSTLIIISLAWILGSMVLLTAAWLYHRRSSASSTDKTRLP